MSQSTVRARHRAARRPSTPLTQLASTATAQMAVVGRRTAVVAASSGLVVSVLGAAPAIAEPNDASGLASVD
ncbi:MAG: glycoside hydrolase, partial [Cellulomonas sp.]|nr:glycoside hydrolase [Cellulomonas sp.]